MGCMHACMHCVANKYLPRILRSHIQLTLIEIFKFVNSIGGKTVGAKKRITGFHCFHFQEIILPRCLGRGRSWLQIRVCAVRCVNAGACVRRGILPMA